MSHQKVRHRFARAAAFERYGAAGLRRAPRTTEQRVAHARAIPEAERRALGVVVCTRCAGRALLFPAWSDTEGVRT